MKRLLMIFTLLMTTTLVADELVEETFAFESQEYNIAFDVRNHWIKTNTESEDSEIAVTFLSPTKKQMNFVARKMNSDLGVLGFAEQEVIDQEEEGVQFEDKVVNEIEVDGKQIVELTAKLVFDGFSVHTHAYFYVNQGVGYLWAIFSEDSLADLKTELKELSETIRPATQELPAIAEVEETETDKEPEEVVLAEEIFEVIKETVEEITQSEEVADLEKEVVEETETHEEPEEVVLAEEISEVIKETVEKVTQLEEVADFGKEEVTQTSIIDQVIDDHKEEEKLPEVVENNSDDEIAQEEAV